MRYRLKEILLGEKLIVARNNFVGLRKRSTALSFLCGRVCVCCVYNRYYWRIVLDWEISKAVINKSRKCQRVYGKRQTFAGLPDWPYCKLRERFILAVHVTTNQVIKQKKRAENGFDTLKCGFDT